VCHETFGPLLYLMTYRDFDEETRDPQQCPTRIDLGDFHQ
jgi:hypothetical protein